MLHNSSSETILYLTVLLCCKYMKSKSFRFIRVDCESFSEVKTNCNKDEMCNVMSDLCTVTLSEPCQCLGYMYPQLCRGYFLY